MKNKEQESLFLIYYSDILMIKCQTDSLRFIILVNIYSFTITSDLDSCNGKILDVF